MSTSRGAAAQEAIVADMPDAVTEGAAIGSSWPSGNAHGSAQPRRADRSHAVASAPSKVGFSLTKRLAQAKSWCGFGFLKRPRRVENESE